MKKTVVHKKTRSDKVLPNGVWRWVPKLRDSLGAIPTPPTISNSNSISLSTTSSNSNLPQISNSNSNTISQIFLSHPSCTVFSQPQPMLVSQPLVENTTELAQRRLQIGLDVGMTVEGNDSRALALIGEYIRRDLAAATVLKMKHQNPDLLFSNGVLLEQEDPTSDEEDCVQSIRTPMATFIDPLDCWNESFLQVEYSNESLSIPPGFDASNNCSIRSLKASIKNHQNNKKSLLGSSRAEVSQCARRQ